MAKQSGKVMLQHGALKNLTCYLEGTKFYVVADCDHALEQENGWQRIASAFSWSNNKPVSIRLYTADGKPTRFTLRMELNRQAEKPTPRPPKAAKPTSVIALDPADLL